MIDCHLLSDRMPVVARGAAAWSADEARHLARCAACGAEWALVGRARRLGEAVPFHLDEAAVADAVLRRVRAVDTAAPRRRIWAVAGLAAAAAAVVLLARGRGAVERQPMVAPRESVVAALPAPAVIPSDTAAPTPPTTVAPPAPAALPRAPATQAPTVARPEEFAVAELDDLDADELAPVLDALNEPFDARELLRSPGWGDLEGQALERALGAREG